MRLWATMSRLSQTMIATGHSLAYRRSAAPVAQLDRALPSEGRGQRFESSRVRHEYSTIQTVCGSLVLGLSANKQHWTRNNADKLLFFVKILHGRCWLVFDLARRRCLSQDRLSPFWEQGLISIRQCTRGVGQCERDSSVKLSLRGGILFPRYWTCRTHGQRSGDNGAWAQFRVFSKAQFLTANHIVMFFWEEWCR